MYDKQSNCLTQYSDEGRGGMVISKIGRFIFKYRNEELSQET